MTKLYNIAQSAALSLRNRLWQSMLWLIAVTVVLAQSAHAVPGGRLATMKRGNFACELAGDAMGESGIRQKDADFAILHSSTYGAVTGRGSYLMTGDLITMTSGPKMGEHYKRVSENFLRRLAADGSETSLRCIRLVLNNQ